MFFRIPIFDAESDGPSDPISKWGLGVVLPSLLAMFGASRFYYQQAIMIGTRGEQLVLTGGDAIAFGVIVVAVALFVHAHYFLANFDRLADYAGLGKVVSLLIGLLSFGYIVIHIVCK